MATLFQKALTVCVNDLLDTYSDMIPDGNTISADTVCENDLLDTYSDMIPDGNTISADTDCVCE